MCDVHIFRIIITMLQCVAGYLFKTENKELVRAREWEGRGTESPEAPGNRCHTHFRP